ncbi:hypothetical protein [Agromyces sp. LHK192]|uniref:hypothetical protein n=1 Tax=Agromyces sp. LHK192 TaxID=2498704 RepID=UPI000FD9B6B7|nr:hypothetical protein [Agromyces sp. LHK192]
MTAALPTGTLPAPRRRDEQRPERRLRPAPEPDTRRPRLAYAVVAVASIAVIVVARLVLSFAMTEGAYEIDGYELQKIELAREQQKLREQIDALESPQSIAAQAEALGMVPQSAPVYLRLSDGAVLGQPTAAAGGGVATSSLVPNALIDDVPSAEAPATGAAGETDAAGPGAGGAAAPADGAAVAPAVGLPTPATH